MTSDGQRRSSRAALTESFGKVIMLAIVANLWGRGASGSASSSAQRLNTGGYWSGDGPAPALQEVLVIESVSAREGARW
jgi:hypothetical protein